MAFPSTPILDNFNRADGALGSSWETSFITGDLASFSIVSNQVKYTTDGVSYSSTRWTTTYESNQEVYLTQAIKDVPGAWSNYLLARSTGTGAAFNSYFLEQRFDQVNFRFGKFINGVSSILDTWAGTWANGYKFGFSVIDAQLRAYVDTGSGFVFTRSLVDNSITGSGKIGFRGGSNSGAFVARWDNFGGGVNIPDPATPLTAHIATSGGVAW